jgi:small ligand-binding sensory domain FIST
MAGLPRTTIVTLVSVRVGTALSTAPDPRDAAARAAAEAAEALGGRACDVAIVFASGAHLASPEATREGIHDELAPIELVGCGAAGVIGGVREIEQGTAVSVWAAALDGGEATTFHAVIEELEEGVGALAGMPDLEDAAGAILLVDPMTFPADPVLQSLSGRTPRVPLLGGLASGRGLDDAAVLFLGDEVLDAGAVGARFDGVEILPCVSQGATPVGPELTITAADGHVITELAGRPALDKLRDTIETLSAADLALIQGGLLMGIVIDSNKPDYLQGDFLVRGLMGADPDSGQVSVAAEVRPGQVVRLHARDARSADRDLREALNMRMEALGGMPPAGALLFSCNGRGEGMFGCPDHDAEAVDQVLDGAPAAGFFAAGEIGPVGGEYFLHGFTATLAVFAR